MKYPEQYELLAVFESEPTLLDLDVPFYYTKSTYKYANAENEEFIFSMTPSYREVHIKVTKGIFEIANLTFNHITAFDILSDNWYEKRIMLTGKRDIFKIQLKPKFSIQYNEEIEY